MKPERLLELQKLVDAWPQQSMSSDDLADAQEAGLVDPWDVAAFTTGVTAGNYRRAFRAARGLDFNGNKLQQGLGPEK